MHVRLISAFLFCIVSSIFVSQSRSAAAVVIGGFDVSRVGQANIATGIFSARARISLLAHFPDATLSAAPSLTSSFLADVDVLLISPGISLYPSTPLSAAEQLALFDFVRGGGNALILADGYSPLLPGAQAMVAPFGMTIVDSSSGPGTKTQPAHPIFDGPFGVQSQVNVVGPGVFTDLGPYATTLATLTVNNLPIITLIDYGAIAPGSGRVLIYSDSNPFADPSADGAFRQHEALFLNSIAFLLNPVPEPSTYALAAIGVAALLAVKRRKR